MRRLSLLVILFIALPCLTASGAAQSGAVITEASVRGHMEFLAGDALNGRGSGTRDEWIAASYIGSQLRRWGVEPLGDDGGYVKTITIKRNPNATGSFTTYNAIGRLTGSDASRSGEVILLSAHLDHLGAGGAGPDRIFNGADDDASGTTAVLELAEALAKGTRPKRTVIFVWFGSEEAGGIGARDFLATPPVPLDRIVANLEFEMMGRPDGAVAAHTLWLTGYERSNLGPALAEHGARLVADPHPEQDFFFRSDNIQLAVKGVVAQTVSSFGVHGDYHLPSDDVSKIDFGHMTESIQSMLEPVLWLANSTFTPEWLPGKKP